MPEKIKPDQNLKAIKNEVLAGIRTDVFDLKNLENIPAVLHQEIAMAMIGGDTTVELLENLQLFKDLDYSQIALQLIAIDQTEELVANLEKFSDLNKEVAMQLIMHTYGDEVLRYAEKFSGFDKQLALELIEYGSGPAIAAHLNKFRGLDQEVALELILDKEPRAVAENLQVFTGLDSKIALLLIEVGYGLDVMNNMDYFDSLDQNKVAEAMLLAGQGGFVRLNSQIFDDLSPEMLAKLNDRNYKPSQDEREKFFGKDLETKKSKKEDQYLRLIDAKGQEIRFDILEQREYWADFYKKNGIDWVKMPKKIELTVEEKEQLIKGAQALCPDGNFENLLMMVIPASLADSGEKYAKLQQKMSEGYNETYLGNNFKADGGFEGLKNKSDKLRIMLVKDAQNPEDDELYKSTLDKSVNQLEAKGGIFEQTGLRGIDAAVYLVWQREYFERTGKHFDEKVSTWLTENRRPLSGRAPVSRWDPDGGRLRFVADAPSVSTGGDLGCRLACTIEK